MLALVDRPSVAFNPCTIPAKTLFIESGYAYQKLSPKGYTHDMPQTELRLGLGHNVEVDIFPPNYTEQTTPSQSGLSYSSVGLKYIAYFDSHQLLTLQGYISPPSGNQYFGAINTGFLINGIYNYNFDSGISFSTLLGLASTSAPPYSPEKNYYSINPIIEFGVPLNDHITSYIELYSQSKTAINQGWGLSMDGGLMFLVSSNTTLDVSCGQRIVGALNNVDHYFGAGFAVGFN